MQAKSTDDYLPRLNFSRWKLKDTKANKTFPVDVLFLDEASLMFDIHNSHLWFYGNSQVPTTHAYENMFSINV